MKHTAAVIFRTLVLILSGVTIGLLIGNGNLFDRDADIYSSGNSKTDQVLHLLRTTYVDSVNTDTIEAAAIDNLLQNLDPHSLYLPAQQAQSVNERLEGGFDGVGITYFILHDTLAITHVYAGGPAAKAGLHAGDKVIAVNNHITAGAHLTLDRVGELFKDKASISLSILHWNTKALQTVKVQPGRVTLSSLDAAYMAAPQTGYIKISKFASTTDADFKTALQHLKGKGMQKVILDLRGNGGGYLNAATALADEFLPNGKLIVYTQGLHERRTDYLATDSGLFQQGKVVVLIDEHSASASEILAGALQDLDRGTIVGRRSFGKGLVQEQFPFSDGSAINLTVARYYTPSGRSIQKSYKNGTYEYHNDLRDRAQSGELYGQKNRFTDSVLKSASSYHTAAGKKVYSGGGIMPDVFVPEDRMLNNPLVKELISNQLFMAYAIDRMQPLLSKYATAAEFIKHYTVSDNEFTAFIVYASHTLPEMSSPEIREAAAYIKMMVKARAVQLKWGDETYYQLMNAQDADVKKAVEVIKAGK